MQADEAEIGFSCIVISRGNAPPILEFAEQALDEVAPAVFCAIVRDRYPAVALGGDNRLDFGSGEFGADGIGVIALVGEQRFDAVVVHSEQRAKAPHVVRLTWRQDEAERPACPSQRAWNLVPKPPHDRPSPWAS